MRKFIEILLSAALFAGVVCAGGGTAFAAEDISVYVGGVPVGITLNADGLIVTGICDVATSSGKVRPLEDANVRVGDVVTAVDGVKAGNLYDFRRRVASSDGEVELSIERENARFDILAYPEKEAASGEYRLGLCLKEDVGGVGTLTFVTEEGAYAALGHHVKDPETGLNAKLQRGSLFDVEIDGVIRGEAGKAGGLKAEINRLARPVGSNSSNTPIGIYGEWKGDLPGKKMRVARQGEAHPGHALVLTTIDGDKPTFYDIDIVKSEHQSESAEKGLVIAVRDKRLLEKTGGIVQGMSGSPILQNGVLVGAVTHVFVTDPTRGYGVHARFMLDEAEKIAASFPRPLRNAA